MGAVEELVVGASQDFELAKRYKKANEFTIAMLLYSEATAKVLKALFVRHTGKEAPQGASIGYLAMRLRVPRDLFDEDAMQALEEEQGAAADASQSAEEKTLYLEGVVKRLLDYGMAYVWA